MKRRCSVTDCEKPHQAKGLCSTHYLQKRKETPCSIDNCNKSQFQAGLCHSHYHRKRTYGDVNAGQVAKGEALEWLRGVVLRCTQEGINECVEQRFHDSESGYATLTFDRKKIRMHVAALLLSGRKGPKAGEVTRHLCNNGKCVNPRHLLVGTQKENGDDAKKADAWKNSDNRGERVNTAKLTEVDVLFIRNSLDTTNDLARRFGVTAQTVSCVRKGKTWKHLL